MEIETIPDEVAGISAVRNWALKHFHEDAIVMLDDGQYVWRRLPTVSAEDCWGILTQEVKALHDSYTEINRNSPAKKPKGRIFVSKAVILLCLAKKSRDPDHLKNFVYDQQDGYVTRYWAVCVDGDLLAVMLYRKGAQAVADMLMRGRQRKEAGDAA